MPGEQCPATYILNGVPQAQQEVHILLHVMGERLAEGLDQRGAHRALGAHAPQELPQCLPLPPPVLAEWKEGHTRLSLPLLHPYAHHHRLPARPEPKPLS